MLLKEDFKEGAGVGAEGHGGEMAARVGGGGGGGGRQDAVIDVGGSREKPGKAGTPVEGGGKGGDLKTL